MEYAKDLQSGKIVSADDASRDSQYSCPRPGCGGRVYFADGYIRRSHFRHYPGEGTSACDEYHPGSGIASGSTPEVLVEDKPDELGLIFEHLENRQGLLLRLPDVPNEELGVAPLAALSNGFVDVFAGANQITRVSALDLRPGAGVSRVEVPPSILPYVTNPSGRWPQGISLDRWCKTTRALSPDGTLFRMQGAEWTRLREDSGVHWGETLVHIADKRSPPPSAVFAEMICGLSCSSKHWLVRHIKLPEVVDFNVEGWLARLGHPIAPRSWATRLVSIPRGYSVRNEPVFWVGDSVILQLESPTAHATSIATLDLLTNSYTESVRTEGQRVSYVAISSLAPGLASLDVAHDRKATVKLLFELRPDVHSIHALLDQAPRLRIWLDDICLEAWCSNRHSVPNSVRRADDVRLDVGVDGARLRISIIQSGKRRVYRSLALSDAESLIKETLPLASVVEVDADNLGRIVFDFQRPNQSGSDSSPHRLAWWDHVRTYQLRHDEPHIPVYLSLPEQSDILLPRHVDAIGLIRSRLAARKRRQKEKTSL